MRADLFFEVAILRNLVELLLFLFFGASASGAGYAMLISIAVSQRIFAQLLGRGAIHWPFCNCESYQVR